MTDRKTVSISSLLRAHISATVGGVLVLCLAVTMAITFVRPLMLKGITDNGMLKADLPLIIFFSAGLFVSGLLEQGMNIVQSKIFNEIQNDMSISLYRAVFEKVLHLKKSYFTDHNSADIINRTTSDIRSVCMVADRGILFVISYILSIIGGTLGLLFLNWKMAIIVISIAPIKVFCSAKMANMNRHVMSDNIRLMRQFSSWFGDILDGIVEIKLWNMQSIVQEKLSNQQRRILHTQKESSLYTSVHTSAMILLDNCVQSTLYVLGGILLIKGELTIGGVMAFISYTSYVLGPITSITSVRYMFSTIAPSLKRLNDFFKLEDEITSIKIPNQAMVSRCEHSLEMRDLAFSYSKELLLKNINFEAHTGEKIAIVGANGSGKSTLMDLLLRFEMAQQGEIIIDGINAYEYTAEQYWNMFAVVRQEPYFFKDSVKNNLDPHNQHHDTKILHTFDMCGLTSFFNERFKGDLDQIIHFDAGNLSGGERKKLAIVRAMLKDAPILIMDEATSDYDYESEQYLSHFILTQFKNKIIIYVTHHYAYIDKFNKVYLLKDGELHLLTSSEIQRLKSEAQTMDRSKGAS